MKRKYRFALGFLLAIVAFAALATIVPPSGGGAGAVWGAITGTLSAQTDLQSALNAKQSAAQVQALIDAAVGNIPKSSIIRFNGVAFEQAADRVLANYDPTDSGSGVYRIGIQATIIAVSVDVLQIKCEWTDQNGDARNKTFFPQGLTSANLNSTGAYVFPTMDIRSDGLGQIVVTAFLTVGAGSITYDAGTTIEFIPLP